MSDVMMERIGAIPERLTAQACFGPATEKNGQTVIPVARVALGFGMGGGSKDGQSGAGGGGGGQASPVAVVHISEKGVEVKPVVDVTRIAFGAMGLLAWNVFWILKTIRALKKR